MLFRATSCCLFCTCRKIHLKKCQRPYHPLWWRCDCSGRCTVSQVLKPLKTVTTLLSSEQQPTVSMVVPLQHHPDIYETQWKDVKSAIEANFEERYSDPRLQQFLNESTAFDPRFKTLPHLDDISRNEIFNCLEEKILLEHPTQVCDAFRLMWWNNHVIL